MIAIDSIPLKYRAAVAGALAYLLWPWANPPLWQYQQLWQDHAASAPAVNTLASFYKKYGDEAMPVLNAQLLLNQSRATEDRLTAKYAQFSDQSRDDGWAEATEFVINYVVENTLKNKITLLDSECRNTMCRIEVATPEGLNKALNKHIAVLAGTLKANELEFHNLVERKSSVVIEFKSDKRMKFGFIEERIARPAERKEWTETVNTWLNQQKK